MKINLLTKQLIISLVIGFLPYCILNFYFVSYTSRMSDTERQITTGQHLQSVAGSLEGSIINFEEMTQWLIGNEAIRSYLSLPNAASFTEYNEAYNKALREMTLLPFSSKSWASIAVFRNDGRCVLTGTIRSGVMTENERRIAQEKNGNWFWSLENGQLSICRLYRDKQMLSRHLGYIKLMLIPEVMLKNFSTRLPQGTESFALLEGDGRLLYSSFPEKVRHVLPMDIYQQLLKAEKKEFVIADPKEAVDYTLMQCSIPNKQLSVVILRSLNRQPYLIYRNTFLCISILGAALILLFQVLFTNRWLIKPLYKLARLMNSIEGEDYSVRFHVRGRDEIAVVGRQFNRMCEKLQSLYEEVYQSTLKAKEAEILALQAEINPHFMFNTLDNIYWMVNMDRRAEAMEMIRALSESFRITLLRTKHGFVTLRTAVEQTRNYLYIQKMRLGDKLNYTLDVDETLQQEDIMVLHLVLQPIVENAVVHGILADDAGEVLVTISRYQETLQYSIYDTGSRANPERIARALEETGEGYHGLALHNINTRIRLKFGAQYGVRFMKPEDRGSLFIVTQPLLTKSEVEAYETDDCG